MRKNPFSLLLVFFIISFPGIVKAQTRFVDLKGNSSDGPISVAAGTQVNLSWTSAKVATCTGSGLWSGSVPVSGTQAVTVNTLGAFGISCQNANGTKTVTDSVTVNILVPPTVTLLADGLAGSETIQSGFIVTLSWSSTNATSLTASGDWPGVGVKALSGLETVRVLATSTYTLTASGPGGTATSTVTVTVSDQPATRAIFKYLPYLAVGFDTPDKSVESIFTETFTNRMPDRRVSSFSYLTPDRSNNRRLTLNRLFVNGSSQEASEGFEIAPSKLSVKIINSFCKDNVLGNCTTDAFRTGWARYAVTQTFVGGEFIDDTAIQISIQKRKANGDIISSFDESLVEPAANWSMYARSAPTEDYGFVVVSPDLVVSPGDPFIDSVLEVKYFDSNSLIFGNDIRQPAAVVEVVVRGAQQVIAFTGQLFGSLTAHQLLEGSLDIRVKSGPRLALTGLKKEISSDGSFILTRVSTFPGRQ